ncbi:hypothetical protein [Leptospira weilii]|uniref:Uncharacterized protein n=1 Tax=Leptospira weilii str. 2006001855 TaxID=996804 RepID=M6FY27_9LEPT|nr:hypothetical protein [Leptospira weilii]EMM71676.1 hypothetical protein LEP1GSC038_0335 [Leptospira weilii str. 2006001855]EMN45439.1 hypothetical protein LEP1GSC086_3730 [Leptospira weilii str. LNT 1234]MCL8265528.1 hypothetical protein [Leptospira weilii]QDK23390.1 hypothetical protein FHG67_12165 [Leptospira weilii]QDK26968.1 hypothetical protein FHG68_10080 [Leptospira weilii]
MKVVSIEFSHGPVAIYAHSFESERVTMHVKEFLSTFRQFQDVTHELSPGIGRVTICSTNPSLFSFTLPERIGTLHLHFSNGRETIEQDVVISILHNQERKIAMEKLLTTLRLLIQTAKPEHISA